jgi:hypothetical protein
MAANHMHENGLEAFTQVIHRDGTTQDLHTDATWSNDQQFNPVYSHFPLATPLVVHGGDTIRTSCTWQNKSPAAIAFPREMCTASGVRAAIGRQRADVFQRGVAGSESVNVAERCLVASLAVGSVANGALLNRMERLQRSR